MKILKKFKSPIQTIFACGVLLLVSLPRGGGLLLILITPMILIYIFASLISIFRNRAGAKVKVFKIVVCLLTLSIAFGHHYYIGKKTRNLANEIVLMVNKYYQETGSYPESIKEIKDDKYRKSNMVYYYVDEEVPSLFYKSTFMIFETCFYKFDSKSWLCRD